MRISDWSSDVCSSDLGARMNDAEVAELLGEAWKTIATGGANKIEPGQFRGTGARANRGSDSRVIHFRDGDAYLDYQQQFGERAIYDVMTGHVQGVAKDIEDGSAACRERGGQYG